MSINYATAQDVYGLSNLFLEIINALPYYNGLAKQTEAKKYTPAELLKKLEEDAKSIIAVKEKEQIVAFCFSRFDDYTIWLEWFGVAPSSRGQKLSNILLQKLEASAQERNCHKIWCDSRTENQQSVNVLTRNGYEKVTLLRNHWYGQDFFLWQKFLVEEHRP